MSSRTPTRRNTRREEPPEELFISSAPISPTTSNLPPTPAPSIPPPQTIASLISANPKLTPLRASRKLFPKPNPIKRLFMRGKIKRELLDWEDALGKKGERRDNDWRGRKLLWEEPDKEELERTYKRGNWGETRPTDLFLKIYSDVLLTLSRDPLAGVCSPSLMGSSGTIPLTIISVIPDIMQHYYDCIVLAKKEVLLATNYWQPSNSVDKIGAAFRELDRRLAERNKSSEQKDKIIIKLMYDRGTLEQLWNNHASVPPSGWAAVKLPTTEEIPNIDLQVINFHRPLLGTFHAKFLVVDRKLALLNSNNIQDRPNLEMMTHLEGSIVDAFYDAFLISWSSRLTPPLPCISNPLISTLPANSPETAYTFQDQNPYLANIELAKAAKFARHLLKRDNEHAEQESEEWKRRESVEISWDNIKKAINRRESLREAHTAGNTVTDKGKRRSFGDVVEQVLANKRRSVVIKEEQEEGMESTEMEKLGSKNKATQNTAGDQSTSKNEPDHSLKVVSHEGRNESKDSVTLHGAPSVGSKTTEIAQESSHLSIPDASHDRIPSDSSSVPEKKSSRMLALSEALNAGALSKTYATVEEKDVEDFEPHILHKAHKPIPIAMVNRKPHGMPGHQDIRVPQAAAWIAGFRYAREKVFIQTPTLNAKPVVRAIVQTCKRNVKVILYLDLGFNDKGESVPFQGGTNEEVVGRLYAELNACGKQDFLDVYWYTGKDQSKPLNAVKKQRNCHVKFMVIDDHVGIMGNGNQDTQSWFHSQEINIMIDSREIVDDWMHALNANQNTQKYGKVGKDGVWRSPTGETLEPPEHISCFKAIWAMI